MSIEVVVGGPRAWVMVRVRVELGGGYILYPGTGVEC